MSGFSSPSVLQLLHSGNGSDTSAGATNLDTVALSGLGVNDQLIVHTSLESVVQQTAGALLYSTTDGVQVGYLGANGILTVAGGAFMEQVVIKLRRPVSSSLLVGTYSLGGTVANTNPRFSGGFTLTTAWTAAWTMALRHTGVVGGGTLNWAWSVHVLRG